MVDPTAHEMQAMEDAMEALGQFIEAQPSTDFTRWKPEAFPQMVEVICGAYVDSLIRQQAEINISLAAACGRQ